MLVLSIRHNVRQANLVLEEVNRGGREQTYPSSLERAFRTIEHDARVLGLERFADVVNRAKATSRRILHEPALVELLLLACNEFMLAADDVEKGVVHKLDKDLERRLKAAAGDAAIPS